MENPPQHSLTLAELATECLLNIPQEDRERSQAEVYKFVRWVGSGRRPNELSPTNVAGYSERITPAEAKSVKSFLTYIKKKGFTTINLASHIRPKKASSKRITPVLDSLDQINLTQEGLTKLETELASLTDQRSGVIEEIRKAAADKDFRENVPLAAARERKSHLEGRIQELETTLKLAKIMDRNQNTAKAKIGTTVVLNELSSGIELSYMLVDSREANPTRGKLSTASPLGKALLDKAIGATIEVSAPAGVFSYRIEDIQLK